MAGEGVSGSSRIECEILSGVWRGRTLAAHRAHGCQQGRQAGPDGRPGAAASRHGDLAGAIKYLGPIRAVLERASARETAARVAAGVAGTAGSPPFQIEPFAYVVEVGPMRIGPKPGTLAEQKALRDASAVYSLDPEQDGRGQGADRPLPEAGDTLGRLIEVRVEGVPLAWAPMPSGPEAGRPPGDGGDAVQAIKGVEIGLGFVGGPSGGLPGPRPDPVDPAAQAGRRWASSGPRTTPAAWRRG